MVTLPMLQQMPTEPGFYRFMAIMLFRPESTTGDNVWKSHSITQWMQDRERWPLLKNLPNDNEKGSQLTWAEAQGPPLMGLRICGV
jgi:hypothetical protein